jgi:hypothetical protein
MKRARHCEERSDEAIQGPPHSPGSLRFARDDEPRLPDFALLFSSYSILMTQQD